MIQTRVIPCLLLNNNGLVKTIKFNNPVYVGDPINAVKIFNEKEVDELILLDIMATRANTKPPMDLIKKIATECFMPLSYGGGIQKIGDIKRILNLGVEKIIINSYAIEHPNFIRQISNLIGAQSIVVSIDVKKTSFSKYEIYSHGGTRATKFDPVKFAYQMQKVGAGEIFLNSIDKDGTMEGYDLNLIKKVSSAINIPVIACGGAGKLEDFKEAFSTGASAVAAGSLFVFTGPYKAVLINYPSQDALRQIFT